MCRHVEFAAFLHYQPYREDLVRGSAGAHESMGENLVDGAKYCDGTILAAIQSRNNSSGNIFLIIVKTIVNISFSLYCNFQ